MLKWESYLDPVFWDITSGINQSNLMFLKSLEYRKEFTAKIKILMILQVNVIFFYELFTELKKDLSLVRYNATKLVNFTKVWDRISCFCPIEKSLEILPSSLTGPKIWSSFCISWVIQTLSRNFSVFEFLTIFNPRMHKKCDKRLISALRPQKWPNSQTYWNPKIKT